MNELLAALKTSPWMLWRSYIKQAFLLGWGWEDSAQDMDDSPGGSYDMVQLLWCSADRQTSLNKNTKGGVCVEKSVFKSKQIGEGALLPRIHSFYWALSLPLALVAGWYGFSFSQTFSHTSVNKKHAYVEWVYNMDQFIFVICRRILCMYACKI